MLGFSEAGGDAWSFLQMLGFSEAGGIGCSYLPAQITKIIYPRNSHSQQDLAHKKSGCTAFAAHPLSLL